MDVVFTTHAADRYVERCNPNLTRHQAMALLERMLEHATIQRAKPPWIQEQAEDAEAGWLMFGDDIAFTLVRRRDKLVATTCMPRSFMNGKIVERRYKRRRKRGHRALVRSEGRKDARSSGHPPDLVEP